MGNFINLLIIVTIFGHLVDTHKLDTPLTNSNGLSPVVLADPIGSELIKESKEGRFLFPETSFTCIGRRGGYYADVETDCQVFHICGPDHMQYNFFCSPGTLFNQKYAICDWSYNVDCQLSPDYYFINDINFDHGEFRSEDKLKFPGRVETPNTILPAPQKALPPFSPSPRDIDTYSVYEGEQRSREVQIFAPPNQLLPFGRDPITSKEIQGSDNPIFTTGVTVPTRYMIPTPSSAISTVIANPQQIRIVGGLPMKPIPKRIAKAFTESKNYLQLNSGNPHHSIATINNELISGNISPDIVSKPDINAPLVNKNPDPKFKLTPAVLISQLTKPSSYESTSPIRRFERPAGGKETPRKDFKVTILTADPQKSGRWIPVKENSKFGDKREVTDQISTKSPTGVAYIRSSLGEISKSEKNSFLEADMKHLFSNYADWSMKMELDNLKSSEGKENSLLKFDPPNTISSTGFEGVPLSTKATKIRLPLEPPAPIPQPNGGTVIEYTEDLNLPNLTGSRNGLNGDINSFKFVQFLEDQIKSKELRTQSRMDANLDAVGSNNFTSISPSKTRKPRIYKIKNKGFRSLSFKNSALSKETKALINLIKNQLNLTSSPFSVRLIEIDDPYSVQYETQKLNNLTRVKRLQENFLPNEIISRLPSGNFTVNNGTSITSDTQSSSGKEENLESIKRTLEKFTFSKDNQSAPTPKTLDAYNNNSTHTLVPSGHSSLPSTLNTSYFSTTESSEKKRIRLTRKGIREQRIGSTT